MFVGSYMKYLFLVGCWLACIEAMSQPYRSPVAAGVTDSLYSDILREKRFFRVYVPKQEPNPAMAAKRFPVIYLLDGDEHFDYVTSLLRRLSEGFTHVLPEMIIVGITNTNRMRDLTPTHVRNTRTISDTSIFRDTGGGGAFLSFLDKELFPYVEQHYPANAYRVLAGHSLGGLMVADAMLFRPGLCQGWISIDPSIWYDDAYLLRRMDLHQLGGSKTPSSFFMAMANNLPRGMDTLTMQLDSSAATEDNRAIQSFAKKLGKRPLMNLAWSWKFYPEDDHGSVTSIALYDGLRYIFREYHLPAFSDLLASDADPVRMLEEWSARNTLQWGFPVYAPEAFVNGLGYTMLYRENPHAGDVFEYNSRCYPESPHVYMALAVYCRSQKMEARARELEARANALMAGSKR